MNLPFGDHLIVTPEPEDKLWIDFIHGDDACYEIIYKRYSDVLFRYGIQFTRDEEVVKDAIHDVFVRIYSHRTHLKTSVNIKFYLFAALKNCLYNSFKREILFEKLDEQDIADISDPAIEDKLTAHDEVEIEKERIQSLLNGLTDRQRELKIEQIEELMHMNYQSVQNLIQRSLKKMRELAFSVVQLLFFI